LTHQAEKQQQQQQMVEKREKQKKGQNFLLQISSLILVLLPKRTL